MGIKGDRISETGKRTTAAIVRAKKAMVRANTMMNGRVHEMSAEFLKTELHSAFTFAGIAEGAVTSKRKRTLGKAREAYDALVRFRGKVKLTGEEAAEIDSGIARLRSTLRRLGESI